MSNTITWLESDYTVGEGEDAVTHLDIFRVPSHFPLNRTNLFQPLVTVPVDVEEYEDTSSVEGENYRYLVAPSGSLGYTNSEWPPFPDVPVHTNDDDSAGEEVTEE